MKVLWVHTFDPEIPSSGNFMHHFHEAVAKFCPEVSVDLFYVSKSGLFTFLRSLVLLRRAKSDYDIIHFQYGSTCAILAYIVRHHTMLVTLRGSDWHRLRKKGNWRQKIHSWLSVMLSKIALRKMHTVIAVSNRIAAEVRQIYKRDVEVVIDPMNDLFFEKCEIETIAPKKRIILNSINANNPIKDLDFAESVVDKLRKKYPAEIEVVKMHNLDLIEVKGNLLAADCLLLTSEYEGWPNCVKEALVCQVPVVSTCVSDLQEWEKKVYGLRCVNRKNVLEFVDAIHWALQLRRSKMICNTDALEVFQSEYAANQIVKTYEQVRVWRSGTNNFNFNN